MNFAVTLGVFLVSLTTALLAVPPITTLALHKNLLDYPDGDRRTHARAVPRLGGVAVFFGFVCSLAFAFVAERVIIGATFAPPPYAAGLVLACCILFAIGLADDIKGVPPAFKLLGQTIAALIVVRGGFSISVLSFPPDLQVGLGWLSLPITVLWLVGMSNAFNLVDGLDGLASGVGVIALLTIAACASILGHPVVTLYAVAMTGALLGFFRHNFAPAKIFLGDSGSLVVGFLLAFLSVRGATRSDGAVYTLVPLFALSYPLLDTGISMLRRWLRGDPLSRADGRHIHHQLLSLGLTPGRAGAVIFAESIVVAVLGLFVTFAPPAMTVAVAAIGLAILMFILVYGVRWLDYHEFIDAATIMSSGASRARSALRDTINARDVAKIIARSGSLEQVEEVLEQSAAMFHFSHIQLGSEHSSLVTESRGADTAGGFWRFEYPIALLNDDEAIAEPSEALLLTIWSTTVNRGRTANAEHVARVIAPAIVSWYQRGSLARHEIKMRYRPSGGARRPVPAPPHPSDVRRGTADTRSSVGLP